MLNQPLPARTFLRAHAMFVASRRCAGPLKKLGTFFYLRCEGERIQDPPLPPVCAGSVCVFALCTRLCASELKKILCCCFHGLIPGSGQHVRDPRLHPAL